MMEQEEDYKHIKFLNRIFEVEVKSVKEITYSCYGSNTNIWPLSIQGNGNRFPLEFRCCSDISNGLLMLL